MLKPIWKHKHTKNNKLILISEKTVVKSSSVERTCLFQYFQINEYEYVMQRFSQANHPFDY